MSIYSMIGFSGDYRNNKSEIKTLHCADELQQPMPTFKQIKDEGDYLHHLSRIYNDEKNNGHAAFEPPSWGDANERGGSVLRKVYLNIMRLNAMAIDLLAVRGSIDPVWQINPVGWSWPFREARASALGYIHNFKDPFSFPTAYAAELTSAFTPAYPYTSISTGITSISATDADNQKIGDVNDLAPFFSLNGAIADSIPCQGRARHVLIAVDMLMNDVVKATTLAQLIDPEVAGGNAYLRNKDIEPNCQAIIHQWIARQLYDDSVFDFIIGLIVQRKKDAFILVSDINSSLRGKVDQLFHDDTHLTIKKIKEYILHNIIAPEFPLSVTPWLHSETNDTLQWGIAHAGLAFAARIGFDVRELTEEEANALGLMIYAQQREGASPPAYVRLFSLPAMMAYHQHMANETCRWSADTRQSIESAALYYYSNQRDVFESRNDPLGMLQSSLSNYKTRVEIADSLKDGDSGAVDKAFSEQNKNIAMKYRAVEVFMISIGFDNLSHEEQLFIDSAEIQIGKFALVKERNIGRKSLILPGLSHDPDRVTVIESPDNIDIFCARKSEHAIRIYALVGTKGHYEIQRVDEQVARYQALLSTSDDASFEEGFRLELAYSPHGLVPATQWGSQRMIEKLAGLHEIIFRNRLYKMGYDTTGWEKIRDIILSLVPFYDCANSIKEGRGSEAIFNCGIDVLAVAPFFGQVGKLSISVGRILGKAGLAAGRNAMINASFAKGARFAAREAIKNASSDFQRWGILPASAMLSREQFISLGVSGLRTLDPFFELFYKKLHWVLKYHFTSGRRMQGIIPKLTSVLVRLQNNHAVQSRLASFRRSNTLETQGAVRPGQILAMERGNMIYWRPFEPSPPPIPSFSWQNFDRFMTMPKNAAPSLAESRKMLDDGLNAAFNNKQFITIKGLQPNPKYQVYPYLLDAQARVKDGFDNVFTVLENARDLLKMIRKEPDEMGKVHKYFEGAFNIFDQDIGSMALMHIEYIIEKCLTNYNKFKKNVIIASTRRTSVINNRYISTLAESELRNGPLAFCSAGDRQNRIVIIADRCFDNDHHLEIHQTIVHEMSHLAAETNDLAYVNLGVPDPYNTDRIRESFDEKIKQKELKLDYFQNVIKHVKGDASIDEQTIYGALDTDKIFRANAMMQNADYVVGYIEDLAKMQKNYSAANRMKREANGVDMFHLLFAEIVIKCIVG